MAVMIVGVIPHLSQAAAVAQEVFPIEPDKATGRPANPDNPSQSAKDACTWDITGISIYPVPSSDLQASSRVSTQIQHKLRPILTPTNKLSVLNARIASLGSFQSENISQ
ncbi:hypothetical protein M378DRAFT_178355 [Amanita muscaria Koide BX008]|uniref:Uncharacterized protein n=1 Tax=Amanita muscaria (strain Koide BX008) TaxID=946122 RepID=A0A0C2SQ35_AMAMK|nr:hypothetical protein M378DRAFT_178355 [Amanita muscaria Koide BX008]